MDIYYYITDLRTCREFTVKAKNLNMIPPIGSLVRIVEDDNINIVKSIHIDEYDNSITISMDRT